MPLTPTVDRQPLHTRNLIIRGYRRADGPLVAMYNPRWHRGAETKAG